MLMGFKDSGKSFGMGRSASMNLVVSILHHG